MPTIRTTPHLFRYFPALPSDTLDIQGSWRVSDLIQELDSRFPGLAGYLIDDRGALRQHVVIFVNNRPIADRLALSDVVDAASEVFIAQALSGG